MTKWILIEGLLFASACLLAFDDKTNPAGCSATTNPIVAAANTVVAEVDGAQLTLGDFEKKHPTALFQARNTFFETQRKAVEDFIGEYLLEQQARKEHLTVAELLDRHVNQTVGKVPSDEALRIYYEGLDTNESFETARAKIIDYLTQRRITKAKAEYAKTLRSQADVKLRMVPPRVEVSLKTYRSEVARMR